MASQSKSIVLRRARARALRPERGVEDGTVGGTAGAGAATEFGGMANAGAAKTVGGTAGAGLGMATVT